MDKLTNNQNVFITGGRGYNKDFTRLLAKKMAYLPELPPRERLEALKQGESMMLHGLQRKGVVTVVRASKNHYEVKLNNVLTVLVTRGKLGILDAILDANTKEEGLL